MRDTRHRVLFLIPNLTGGGAQRVIITLLHYLDRSRFKLTIAVLDTREAVYLHDLPEDVELIDLGCSRVRYALPKIIRLIWQRRPDAVFSTLGHLNLAMAILRPLLPDGVRYLARETSIVSETLNGYPFSAAWAWAYRRYYGRFDCVICQSRWMRDDLVERFGFPAERSVVINNPVDVDRIRSLAGEPVVTGLLRQEVGETEGRVTHLVAAGRMSQEKGFDLVIETLALCRNPRVQLTLLGDGPLRTELAALARTRGVEAQVRFVGFQKNPYPFFAQADAFVLSSRFEGFPNVVLEALACGTPVIATPAPGGTQEILENIPGCIMAKALTPESLTEALNSFIPGRRVPAQVVEPYAVKTIVDRYTRLLLSGTAETSL